MINQVPICPIEFDESLTKHKVEFSVPGKPFAKQRPRVVTRGGFARAYTPKQTVDYENLVKKSYSQTVGNLELNGPISAKIEGVFPIPKSISKKDEEMMLKGDILHTKKPDCDNIAKSVLDALNGIAYNDDSQVCKLSINKVYGEIPKTNVILEEIKQRKEYNKW